jgi:hypothetical protein
MKEARKLLRRLRNTGRFRLSLGKQDRTWKFAPITGPARTTMDSSLANDLHTKTVSGAQSCGVPVKVITGTAGKPSWFRRFFMPWSRPQSVDVKHAPVPFSQDVAGVGDRRRIERRSMAWRDNRHSLGCLAALPRITALRAVVRCIQAPLWGQTK